MATGAKDIKDMTPAEAQAYREQEARENRRDKWSEYAAMLLQGLVGDKNKAATISLHITLGMLRYGESDVPRLRKQIREIEKMRDTAIALNNSMAALPWNVAGDLQAIFNLASLANHCYIPRDWPGLPEDSDKLQADIRAAKTLDDLGEAIERADSLKNEASFHAPAPTDATFNLCSSLTLLHKRYSAFCDAISKTPRDRFAVRDLFIRQIIDLIWNACPDIGDWDSVDTICEIITLAFEANDIPVPDSGDTTKSGEESQGRLRRMVKEYLQSKGA